MGEREDERGCSGVVAVVGGGGASKGVDEVDVKVEMGEQQNGTRNGERGFWQVSRLCERAGSGLVETGTAPAPNPMAQDFPPAAAQTRRGRRRQGRAGKGRGRQGRTG